MYHELTTKNLIEHTHGMLREIEAKLHAHEIQVAMNLRLQKHYAGLEPPNKQGAEAAKQQVARDRIACNEIRVGIPAIVAHLDELQALDAAEDAARELAEPSETPDETNESSDASAQDSPAEPATSEPLMPFELATRQNGRKAREPVPV